MVERVRERCAVIISSLHRPPKITFTEVLMCSFIDVSRTCSDLKRRKMARHTRRLWFMGIKIRQSFLCTHWDQSVIGSVCDTQVTYERSL